MSGAVTTEAVPARRGTSVASAAAILMVGFVLSRLLGLARVSIQASVLGASGHDAAAFTTAIAIPDFVFTLVSGGALASSFIPVFTGLLERGDEEVAWRMASGVLNAVLLVMLAAVVVAELAAPGIVALMARPADQALTLTLTRIMLLQPLFLALSGILMGLYNSYHRFVAPAVAPLVYNLANIVGLLLVGVFHHAVALAAWGVTVGALLQVLVMLPGLAVFQRAVRPGRGLKDPGTHEVGRLMVPRIVGQAGIQLSSLVTITLANLDFADRPSAAVRLSANLMALPVGIFGGAVATAVFPTLARHAARGDRIALGHTVAHTLRTMLFLSTPAAVGLMVLRYPITMVLFQRGDFSAHDVDLVAAGLLLWGAGVPVLVAVELLPRAFFALKDTWTPVRVNLVTLATAIALSLIGVRLAHGHSVVGVALLAGAVSVTVLMEVVWLGLILRGRIAGLSLRDLGRSILCILAASGAMGVALLALLYLWHRFGPDGVGGDALLLVVALPLGVAVYAGWAYIVDAPELATAWAMVHTRLRRWMRPTAR
jgi:putative peptidoglycan lipid II flippase